ncbi:Piezo-type mechanosensitive ion channel component 2 [Liparis tanakae]|uniref:Piezo-type mechanosensitive ion channel component 2 n=1 Tax=Liparis tanakae TaxID=230148 RepID=A0A4Z2JEP5_9TELE|nr:Piezo-type mechanosensitive ion channel component 2 [Liparis tanakae]
MSYYFLHVVADIRASQILACRGAELFQATIVKAVRARLEEERKSVEQLKRQMERIKVRQQKFKRGKERMMSIAQESGEGPTLIQPEEDDDDGAQRAKAKTKKKQWWRPWVDHASSRLTPQISFFSSSTLIGPCVLDQNAEDSHTAPGL